MKIQTVPFQTKEEFAYLSLRGAILSCELPPGEKLVIDRLSAELGISQIPIRAAVQRLQTEGLVDIHPHSSPVVAQLSPDKVNEVFLLLESLELTAFRAAAEKITPAGLDELEDLIGTMSRAIEDGDTRAWMKANAAFHRCIAEITEMALLVDFTDRVLNEWERVYNFFFKDVSSDRLPEAQEDHCKILTCMSDGDLAGLDEMALIHNRKANQAYQAILEEKGA